MHLLCGWEDLDCDGRDRRERVCHCDVCGGSVRVGEYVRGLCTWDVLGGGGFGLCELCVWYVLGRDGREQCGRLCELSSRGVFGGLGRERVYHLFSRRVFAGGGERVYHLFSRRVLAGGGERMHRMFRRRVLGRIGSEQFDGLCAMPGGGVLGGLRRERVCAMPDRIELLGRIRVRHKLRLQRRVLRPERRGVCAMPGRIVLGGRVGFG